MLIRWVKKMITKKQKGHRLSDRLIANARASLEQKQERVIASMIGSGKYENGIAKIKAVRSSS